jgi:glutathione synthase/RimK-type ligase-like ATP-grasp enzyme
MILVLSAPEDTTAERVRQELGRRGKVLQFDPASFPLETKLTARSDVGAWQVHISGRDIELPFDDVTSVWVRRPGLFRFHPDLPPGERRFASREAQMAIGGLLRSLDCLWVNHPDRLGPAEFKPLQLKLAAEVGFEVPRSLITNDPDAVMSFFDDCDGRIIYKPLSGGDLPAPDDDTRLSVYTSVVERRHLQTIEAVSLAPCLFQEYVPKKSELRVTVIGGEVFPVQIESQHAPESAVDWRRGYEHLRYGVYRLPRDVRERCLRLTRRLGLMFAAIDFAVTPEDEHVFLDLNPSGQWAWLEFETGLPMTQAMADLLSRRGASEEL